MMVFGIQFYYFLLNYSRQCLALDPISVPNLSVRTRKKRASSSLGLHAMALPHSLGQ